METPGAQARTQRHGQHDASTPPKRGWVCSQSAWPGCAPSWKSLPIRLLRNVRRSATGSGGVLQEGGREVFLAQQHGRAHHGVSEVGDAPAARAGNLAEEPAEMQPFEEAGDLGAAPTIVGGGRAEEAQAERAVPEA